MKLVKEHINFTRGQDPKAAMNIGKKAEIIKWLTDLRIKTNNYEIDDHLNIYIKNHLFLGYTNTELPDNLTVDGDLFLNFAKITKLPDNLTVGGSLDIRHTNITKLPDNLKINGNLWLQDTKIVELPKDLVVIGKIYGFEQ